jgi:hypothetical protein
MPAPVVLVLTLFGEGHDARTDALTRAVRVVLGPAATVVVDPEPSLPPDAEAIESGRRVSATTVVEVQWSETGSASLHVHFEGHDGWVDRDLEFEEKDPPEERGRAAGFAVGSMILASAAPAPSASSSAPVPPPPPPPAPTVRPVASTTPSPRRDTVPTQPARPSETSVDVSVEGRWIPIDSSTTRGGGGLDVAVAVASRLAVEAGAVLTFGKAASNVSSWALAGCAGLLGRPWMRGAFELDVAAGPCVLREAYARDGLTLSRVAPGARIRSDAVAWAVHGFGLYLGAEGFTAFGTTSVDVGGGQVAQRPPVWLTLLAGARARF